jgi:ERCC4-type nuclease
MITIDDREKDSQFINSMTHGTFEFARLEFADASFIGNGENEEPVLVGIERKALSDLLNSITSGRFAGHQLPGLLNSYGVVYLLIEGMYRPGKDGLLYHREGKDWVPISYGRKWMYADLEAWLTTVEEKANVRLRRAPGPSETAAIIQALHRWWTNKEFSEHRSHLTMHKPRDTALLRKASLVRVIAAELPGIGWTRSENVAKRFHTVAEMVSADEREWNSIEGIGKETANKVVHAIYGIDMKAVKERRA